jgi:KipI family sensor histidine kinase inhibitor
MTDAAPITPVFLPAGDTALVVEFGDRVDRELSRLVLALDTRVKAAALPGVVETVPTFRSLMVHIDPRLTDVDGLEQAIRPLAAGLTAADVPGRRWFMPACYEGDYAPDIEDVAARTGLSADDVIGLHSGRDYHVYMIGFLPGYPYMGDLPDELSLPRRDNPRIEVPAGSIAIAMTMTAVYVVASPGGWHLIGRTPVRLFDKDRSPPALLQPGDKVRFEPVPEADYAAIERACADGSYEVRSEDAAA